MPSVADVVFAGPVPLVLDFSPEAIRQHFDSEGVNALSDEQLKEAAVIALNDDELYGAFHGSLRRAVHAVSPKLPWSGLA
jgi:hypothetical protein